MKKYFAPRINHPICAQWYLIESIKFTYLYAPEQKQQIYEGLEILSNWLKPSVQNKMIDKTFKIWEG